MEPESRFIGFPPPLLGERPIRLPVVFDDGDWLALQKPTNVLVLEDNWYPRLPVLVEAIRYQAGKGKPELQEMGIGESGLWANLDVDPEVSGPVLFSRDRNHSEASKSSYGSGDFLLTFGLVVRGGKDLDSAVSDLPIARHAREKRMLVSHTTGKQCRTEFQKVGRLGRNYTLWQAQTRFARRHQIFLHAVEVGLRIVGDRRYAKEDYPLLSRLKSSYRPSKTREERPLLESPAIWLQGIRLPNGTEISGPVPDKVAGFLKQLERLG